MVLTLATMLLIARVRLEKTDDAPGSPRLGSIQPGHDTAVLDREHNAGVHQRGKTYRQLEKVEPVQLTSQLERAAIETEVGGRYRVKRI